MLKNLALMFIFVCLPLVAFAQETPVGKWKTIDDETKREKSLVEITETDGKLSGKILEVFKNEGETVDTLCTKCEGAKKDQPIVGMTFLWDLQPKGDEWTGGRILDPKNGKEYSAKIKVVENGARLKVRGFLGISLLGRSQTWERAK